jgi:hypothetical protein
MIFIDLGEHTHYCDSKEYDKTWTNKTGKVLQVVFAWAWMGVDMGSTVDAQHVIYRTSDHLPLALGLTDATRYRGHGNLTHMVDLTRLPKPVLLVPGDGVFARGVATAYLDNFYFNITRANTRISYRGWLWLEEYNGVIPPKPAARRVKCPLIRFRPRKHLSRARIRKEYGTPN